MEQIRFDLAAGWWWLFALIVVAAAVLAFVSYARTTPPLSRQSKVLLGTLRTIGIACLVLMLFEPILRLVRSTARTPKIAVAIDVSRSMAIVDTDGDRALKTRQTIEKLNSALGDEADVFLFDEKLQADTNGVNGNINFDGFRTDIAHAIGSIANRSMTQEYGAVVLVTDGNHNTGEVPLHVAERSGMAIYSVGIGDTVPPKDIRIAGILVNGIAVVGEVLPVTVMIGSSNIDDQYVDLVLDDNGSEVSRQRIAVRRGNNQQSALVQWTPKSDGMRKLSARISAVAGEFTTQNNFSQEFVNVRKDKRRIVLFAGAPSPDVTFIKSALTRDPSVSVQTYIQKQGPEYYEGLPPSNVFDDIEAVILIGWPIQSTDRGTIDRLATACNKGTSLLFIPSLQVDYNKLAALNSALPFNVGSSRPQEFLVTPDVTRGATSDPVLKITGTDADAEVWNNLPPIYRTETFVDVRPGSVVLATIRVGNAPLDDPLIIKREDGKHRSLAVLGYGLYRWKLLGEGLSSSHGTAVDDVLQSFVNNSLRWLSVRDDQRRVRIKSTHILYASGESVGFSGSIQDQTFAPVDDADVRVEIQGPAGKRDVLLSSQGSGRYAMMIGPLAPGDYSYVGNATSRGTQIGRDKGRFTVGTLGLEDGAATRNNSLLQALANRSGAVSVSVNQIDSLLAKIKSDPRLQPIARSSEREFPLYHLPWLIAVAIAAFSSEWFLRKRRGLV